MGLQWLGEWVSKCECVSGVLYSQPLLVFSTPSCVTTLGMLVWHGHGGVGVGCARVWVCHGENVGVWLQWLGEWVSKCECVSGVC